MSSSLWFCASQGFLPEILFPEKQTKQSSSKSHWKQVENMYMFSSSYFFWGIFPIEHGIFIPEDMNKITSVKT